MTDTFDNKYGLGQFEPVEIIAQNVERFISFEFIYLKFIDSCQFLSASLGQLVSNLVQACRPGTFCKFEHTRKQLDDDDLLFQREYFLMNGLIPCPNLMTNALLSVPISAPACPIVSGAFGLTVPTYGIGLLRQSGLCQAFS